MKIAVYSVCKRGDVQPYAALRSRSKYTGLEVALPADLGKKICNEDGVSNAVPLIGELPEQDKLSSMMSSLTV